MASYSQQRLVLFLVRLQEGLLDDKRTLRTATPPESLANRSSNFSLSYSEVD